MSDPIELQTFDCIDCILSPRPEYKGLQCYPELLAAAGERLTLRVLWDMDENDKYPGEWAVERVDRELIHGRSWIASGDVTIVAKVQKDHKS